MLVKSYASGQTDRHSLLITYFAPLPGGEAKYKCEKTFYFTWMNLFAVEQQQRHLLSNERTIELVETTLLIIIMNEVTSWSIRTQARRVIRPSQCTHVRYEILNQNN